MYRILVLTFLVLLTAVIAPTQSLQPISVSQAYATSSVIGGGPGPGIPGPGSGGSGGSGGPLPPSGTEDEEESPKQKDIVEIPPQSSGEAPPQINFERDDLVLVKKAPIVISGENIYVVWWNNNTGNDEVMFRSSSDTGATFADKINLSNTTSAESQDAEIAADGDSVIVSWWERNATSNEPVVRISGDSGATFGPILKLAANGTIGISGGDGGETE